MTQKTIFFMRRKTPRVTLRDQVTFDSVMGLGINKNFPYDFRYKRGGKIYGSDLKALLAMGEKVYEDNTKSLFDLMPILPPKPQQFNYTTKWYEYPETTPEVRDLVYRCRFGAEGNDNRYTFLQWSGSESAAEWAQHQVYEYTPALSDGEEVEENLNYEEELAIYNATIAENKLFIREHFVLVANLVSPKIPTEKTNLELEGEIRKVLNLSSSDPIPDEYLWHWWKVRDDGTKVPISTIGSKEFVFAPIQIDNFDHAWWDRMALNSILQNDPLLRARQILNIK